MQTFLDYYKQEIQPQIAAIDIFLKSEEPPYDREIVRELLGISSAEWEELLQKEQIVFLTRGIFSQLMKGGTSPLCGMFRRAVELSLPETYTPEMIAYIFHLPIETVQKAVRELDEKLFTDAMLPRVFAKISLAETQFPF